VAYGLGLYVDYEYPQEKGVKETAGRRASKTTVTAALPMARLGDPATGNWKYYVLIGPADSRHPSMMLHAGPDGALTLFSRAAPGSGQDVASDTGRPVLTPILVSNRN
jgi:hypothetical protein